MAIKEEVGVLTYKDEQGNKTLLYPAVKTDTTLTLAGEPADAASVTAAITKLGDQMDGRLDQLEENAGGSRIICTCVDDESIGVTLTGTMNGQTYTAVVGSDKQASFMVKDCGTFVITGTEEYKIKDISVEVLYFGIYYVNDIKSLGKFDYAEWIATAGLSASTYADLDAVLADEKAVRTLMTKTAAVDYLAAGLPDVPEVAEQILNDIYVAKWVNYREYAYSTLSAVAEIKSVMDASGKYGMYITVERAAGSKALVPTLTSDTGSDGGTAFSSSNYSGRSAYYAFDSADKGWLPSIDTTGDDYVGYKFTQPTCVNLVYINYGSAAKAFTKPRPYVKVQASNNFEDWVDLSESIELDTSAIDKGGVLNIELDNNEFYMHYRVYFSPTLSYSNVQGEYINIHTLQFYGNQLIPMVPTGDTNNIIVSSASNTTSYVGGNVFDGDTTTCWRADGATDTSPYIGYKFDGEASIRCFSITPVSTTECNRTPKEFTAQTSTDGVDWEDVKSFTNTVTTQGSPIIFTLDSAVKTQYFRILIKNNNNNDTYPTIGELQFYGVEKWYPKGLVPVMTSNTAPYGEASASGVSSTTSYPIWKAFDGDETTGWIAAVGANKTDTLTYKFVSPTCVKTMDLLFDYNGADADTPMYKLQASNDGSTYIDLSTYVEIPTDNVKHTANITNDDYYLYYQLSFNPTMCVSAGSGEYTVVNTLQFYGRQLEALVPPMTSNTAPVGEVIYSKEFADQVAYYAFDNDNSSRFASYGASYNKNEQEKYIGYSFTKPIKCNAFSYLLNFSPSTSEYYAGEFYLQGSNNKNDWDTIYKWTFDNTSRTNECYFTVDNNNEYTHYRIMTTTGMGIGIPTTGSVGYYISFAKIQFYGTPDYDSRTYIYDHGVEVTGLTLSGTATKEADSIKLTAANDTATVTIDTTDNKLLSGTAGLNMSGTNTLICGSASATFTASPKANLDISSVNGDNATGVKQTAAGTFECSEIWLI